MYPSPPMTQQPPQSQPVTSPRLNVPDDHLQSSDNRSHAHAVKLALRQVNFFYGDHQALFKIDIEIMKNQVTSFIGPSGCGKSTLLRCLNRLNDLIEGARVEGAMLLDGIDINGHDVDITDLRKRVGMVFQKSNPFPKSIYENVAYGPRLHGIRNRSQLDQIIEDGLKGAGLWDEVKDRLQASAFGLSGGQQQRVAVARALAGDPSILLADEPTGNLDSINGEAVMDLLRELHRSGATICMVTHDPRYAKYADRSIHLFDGRIVEDKIYAELN